MKFLVVIFSFYYLINFLKAEVLGNKSMTAVNLEEHPGKLCIRDCKKNDSRICYFKFNLEFYQAMGVACKNCTNGNAADCDSPQCAVGDGIQKGFMTINRQLPGPAIQVCLGDRIVVDYNNLAPGTGTTIHWHGLLQRNSKFMDGVPYVTQCPIPFSTTFRYDFQVDNVGTFFYHSHAGFQKPNGVYGALIIRKPIEDDALAHDYDFDLPQHYLLVSDWLHEYAEFLYPGIQRRLNKPHSVLLNGRGTYINNNTRIREVAPPPHVFNVKAGKKYRFRAIGAHSFACPMQLQVESHKLTIVSTDGHDVEPTQFDTLVLNAGERYDFVIHTNQAPGDYWIRLRGLGVCESDSLTEAFILLRYKVNATEKPLPAFPNYDDTYPQAALLNYPNKTCNNRGQDGCVTSLKALEEDKNLRNAEPDIKFYIGFTLDELQPEQVFNTGDYEHFRNLVDSQLELATINNISFVEPSSPLLSQPNDVDESLLCDEDHLPKSCKNIEFCPCVHRLKVKKGSVVEMLLVDETKSASPIHHPIHLHGFDFMVTDLSQPLIPTKTTKHLVKIMDESGKIARDMFNERPPIKDTVSVPNNGYAIVRFRANNIGYWFMHCHYDYHMTLGMALVVQVGEKEEMPRPPYGFPKCGNFLPKVYQQ